MAYKIDLEQKLVEIVNSLVYHYGELTLVNRSRIEDLSNWLEELQVHVPEDE